MCDKCTWHDHWQNVYWAVTLTFGNNLMLCYIVFIAYLQTLFFFPEAIDLQCFPLSAAIFLRRKSLFVVSVGCKVSVCVRACVCVHSRVAWNQKLQVSVSSLDTGEGGGVTVVFCTCKNTAPL